MDEPIDQGDDTARIGGHLSPLRERLGRGRRNWFAGI